MSDGEIAAAALRRDPEVIEDLRYQISELSAARRNFTADLTRLNSALAGLRREE